MNKSLTALGSTFTEILDSKKWIGSYVAAIFASVLHLYFGVSIENALLLASPISLGVLTQAHVDASEAKAKTAPPTASVTVNKVDTEAAP